MSRLHGKADEALLHLLRRPLYLLPRQFCCLHEQIHFMVHLAP